MNSLTFEGACFCNDVTFTATIQNLDLKICHCSMCRKMAGASGFLSFTCTTPLIFHESKKLRRFDSSSQGERGFCSTCGTPIFYRWKEDSTYFVVPSLLHELPEEKIHLTTEIFYDHKPCYYAYAAETVKKRESDFKK